MLQLKDIRKAYSTGGFTQKALDGVSISFRDNEFVAVLGPSGSGKTTMLNIIGGLDHYDSGDLVIEGVSTKEYRDRDWDAYRNNRIGFVFQSYNLIPHQTVLANVELALTLSGVPRDERRRRAEEALERVGLGEHINKKPSQLSGGQMQRVAIARALINDPEILLADEPTGALDSKTSVQIMNLLTEIASDRLVVMVTHNPDLADEYATRIVNLADGRITDDSDPYDPTADEVAAVCARPTRRTHMSFLTALSLSFNNLMTKKGRTLMTAIAGSIGIIGIAAILALANGVNNYIKTVEEETLSVYPLQIMSTGFDFTSLIVANAGGGGGSSDDESGKDESETTLREEMNAEVDEGTIGEAKIMSRMFASIGSNDLMSLKAFLDSGESGIEQYTNCIYYEYAVVPQIYSANTEDGVRQVNPDQSFASLGIGSGASTNSLMSMTMSTDVFAEMMDNNEVIAGQYEVVAGRWPEKANELVLVVSQSGKISDFMSYVLELRDPDELKEMVKQFANEEEIATPTDDISISYDDVLGKTFKLVHATDYYKYDEERNVWIDKTDDKEYMKRLVEGGEDLVIVGILKPDSDASAIALSTGLYYTPALTRHIVDQAAETDIVKSQLADSKMDVFTGRTFEEEAEDDGSDFDMQSIFTIDETALASAFSIDESALTSGISGLELDASSLGLDASSFGGLDLSGIDMSNMSGMEGLDPSTLFDPSALANITLPDNLMQDAIDAQALGTALSDIMNPDNIKGWAQAHPDQAASTGINPMMDPMGYFAAISQLYMADPETQAKMGAAISGALDTNKLSAAISESIQTQIAGAITQQMQEKIIPALVDAMQKQIASQIQPAVEKMVTDMMSKSMEAMSAKISSEMQKSMQQLATNMSGAMSIDTNAFMNAFQFSLTEEELSELMLSMIASETASYDNNLKKLGYADFDKPSEVSIYPIDFESKEHIVGILDNYNEEMRATDEDKVISYTDIVGTLMESVTTIVNMISTVLIAFVAISLIVSSIMIGVITYISVLERRKEIGILRSIGASKGNISSVFNAETVIEGLIAGLLGVGITAIGCIPANAIVYNIFDVPNVALLPVDAAAILVLISVALTFIAGLIPSRSASRKDPVEALRSE